MDRPLYKAVLFFLRPALSMAVGFRVYGRANVPRAGGAVIAANHQSFLDPLLVGSAIDRPLDAFARSTLFRPPLGPVIRALGAIPVERARERAAREPGAVGIAAGGLGAIRAAIERLKQGRLVLIFPEGTRTHTGEVGPFEDGIHLLARRGEAPVVPVAIEGAFEAWPRTRRTPRLGAWCAVAIGRPIEPRDPALLERTRAAVLELRAFLRARRPR